MPEMALNSPSSFPAAHCEACGKIVLVYIGDAAEGQRFCVHCDGSIESALKWITAEELSSEGYEIGAPNAARAGGGCGSSCGTCSTRGH
jgi:hypothetical protein